MTDRHLVTLQVVGRPATFATTHEKPWKEAVRAAVTGSGVQPHDARFAVRMEFRLAAARNPNEVWDLDNLIKPTLDAMEGSVGDRGKDIRSRRMIAWTALRPPSGYHAPRKFQEPRSMYGSSSRTEPG